MAKVITIPTSGKVGLTVTMNGRYGQVQREWTVPANPNTAQQLAVRERLAAQARAFDGLTQAQQNAWNTRAASIMSGGRCGTRGPLTGLQLFTKCNCNLTLLGQEPLTDPPGTVVIGACACQNMVIANNQGAITVKLTTPTSPGTSTLIRASACVNSGTRRTPSLRILGVCPAPVQGSSDITSLYVAKFGTPIEGMRIFATAQVLEGGFAGPLATFTAVVPAS